MSQAVRVRVPATSANLGPGFDCLALALDLWNQVELRLEGDGIRVIVRGEGSDRLPRDETNLVAQAALGLYHAAHIAPPPGLRIECVNRIPLSSGLGSSAAARLAGLLGANALAGEPLSEEEILELAADLEGHPDNVSAALAGGLALSVRAGERLLVRSYAPVLPLPAAVVVPEVNLPTVAARRALPKQAPLADAVFNLGRTALVVEALRSGDLDLLGEAMQDRLHQPYRLALIPGAAAAIEAALRAGASAAALSGAGPGVIAFPREDPQAVAAAMKAEFTAVGVRARAWILAACQDGAAVEFI